MDTSSCRLTSAWTGYFCPSYRDEDPGLRRMKPPVAGPAVPKRGAVCYVCLQSPHASQVPRVLLHPPAPPAGRRWFSETQPSTAGQSREDRGSGTLVNNKLTCQPSPLLPEAGNYQGFLERSDDCFERLTSRILWCSAGQLERRCQGAPDESGSSPRLVAGLPNSPGPRLTTHCSQLSSSH